MFDGEDYVGDLAELDSAEMASPELKAITFSVDDETSTMKV